MPRLIICLVFLRSFHPSSDGQTESEAVPAYGQPGLDYSLQRHPARDPLYSAHHMMQHTATVATASKPIVGYLYTNSTSRYRNTFMVLRSATTEAVQYTERVPELRDDAVADSLWITWTAKCIFVSFKQDSETSNYIANSASLGDWKTGIHSDFLFFDIFKKTIS